MNGCDIYIAIANYTDGRLCDWTLAATQDIALKFLRDLEKRIIKEQEQKGMELFGDSNLKMYIQAARLEPKEGK